MLTTIFILSIINSILIASIFIILLVKVFPMNINYKKGEKRVKYKVCLDIGFREDGSSYTYNTSFLLTELNEIAYRFGCEIEDFQEKYGDTVKFKVKCTPVELKEIISEVREKAPKLRVKETARANKELY